MQKKHIMENIHINIVVAFAEGNRCIGKDNQMPGWKLPVDMRRFKELTEGHVVIMGRKTFESFPPKYRPLPNRINIIISRNKNYVPEPTNDQTFVCNSLGDAIILGTEKAKSQKLFIIGGGEIYKQAFDSLSVLIDTVYATVVKGEFEGDTFFPELSPLDWHRAKVESFLRDEKNSHDCEIQKWVRTEILH
jgi:dihydrofolate reductase